MEKTVDKLLRNLEFFQLTSHVNDAVYTFLPLSWQELRDDELSFKKSRDEKNESYTCEINLDLEPLGKLNVSVTVSEGRFFVTFYTEESSLKEVIGACAGLLESRFSDAGLLLAAVNVTQKEKVSFGVKKERGLHIRI
jgi:flagellar hook-length control protein FliK